MKKLSVVLIIMFFGLGYAFSGPYEANTTTEEKESPPVFCPATKFTDNSKCMDCHIMRIKDGKPFFGLKEINEHAYLDLPYGAKIITEVGINKLYYESNGVDSAEADKIEKCLIFVDTHRHLVDRFVIEFHSPGGSVFSAWRIKGLMDHFKTRFIIETRCWGWAASAGLILYVNGTIGYRIASPTAEFMAHELWTMKMFDVATPTSKQDEADVLRHLQDTINHWMVSRSTKGMTYDDLSKRCKRLEFWFNGRTAADELGWVDKLVYEVVK